MWGATYRIRPGRPPAAYFNPRSPCGERPQNAELSGLMAKFQSTLPVWGATQDHRRRLNRRNISIHAPRVGSDPLVIFIIPWFTNFNPRSPCGERHLRDLRQRHYMVISIHAPRVGSDQSYKSSALISTHFNPRSPCGERRLYLAYLVYTVQISIHAPRVGSDLTYRKQLTNVI